MIRNACASDRDAIRALLLAAFSGRDEADLVERLRAHGDAAIELVWDESGTIAAHVLFSPMAAPFRALALAPLAVLPERQRQGIGTALARAGIERARAGGWDAVFVLGDAAYYPRFGFDAALAQLFPSPYSGPHWMALALGAAPLPPSPVGHAPAFAAPA